MSIHMDVLHQLEGYRFVWNEDKAHQNDEKHGLTFERACEVFLDPLMQLWDASPNEETRVAAVGATLDREVIYVVHVEIQDLLVRIISARYATKPEIKHYETYE